MFNYRFIKWMFKFIFIMIILFVSNFKIFAQSNKIEDTWENLIKQDVCFLGNQDYKGEKDEIYFKKPNLEAGPFSFKEWQSFLMQDIDKIVPFLINQIHDIRPTNLHICPFNNALRGELAVYCLQHILKKNWYDLDENYKKIFTDGVEIAKVNIARIEKDYKKLKEFRNKYKYNSINDNNLNLICDFILDHWNNHKNGYLRVIFHGIEGQIACHHFFIEKGACFINSQK